MPPVGERAAVLAGETAAGGGRLGSADDAEDHRWCLEYRSGRSADFQTEGDGGFMGDRGVDGLSVAGAMQRDRAVGGVFDVHLINRGRLFAVWTS